MRSWGRKIAVLVAVGLLDIVFSLIRTPLVLHHMARVVEHKRGICKCSKRKGCAYADVRVEYEDYSQVRLRMLKARFANERSGSKK